MEKQCDYSQIPVVELDNARRPSIQCLLAKLTDFSLATLQNVVSAEKMAGRKPRIMMHVDSDGISGSLRVAKSGSDDTVVMRWSLQAMDNPETKEIVISQAKKMNSIGSVNHKFGILATDSTFSEAGVKQKKLLEESLEKSSKIEIKQPAKNFNSRSKHSTLTASSKSHPKPSSKPMITPVDRLKSQQKTQKVSNVQPASGSSSTKRESIRSRIIHTLAGVTRSKTEIFTILQREGGVDDQENAQFDAIISEVSEQAGDKFKLRDEILMTEVNPNYPNWEPMQKRLILKLLKQTPHGAHEVSAVAPAKSNLSDAIGVRAANSPRPPMVRLSKNKKKEKSETNDKTKTDSNKEIDLPLDEDASDDRIDNLAQMINELLVDAPLHVCVPDEDYLQQYCHIPNMEAYKHRHEEYDQLYQQYSELHDKLTGCKNFLLDTYNRFVDKKTTVKAREELLTNALERLSVMINEGQLRQERQRLANVKHQMAAIKTRLNQFEKQLKEPLSK